MKRPNDWAEAANATAAAATATHAAEADRRHVLDTVYAGYEDASQTGSLTIRRGTTDDLVFPVVGQGGWFPVKLRGHVNELVEAELSAGSAGIVGRVNLAGYTE